MGFSHGFRPQRSPHSAPAALEKALMTQRVNFVLYVDRTFFDSVDQGMAHADGGAQDRRPPRASLDRADGWEPVFLDKRPWKACRWHAVGLALERCRATMVSWYVVDLWVHQWREMPEAGAAIVCRYADDMVLGCQFEADGMQLLADLKDRLEQFGLSLHEGKTRAIELGRSAATTELPLGGDARSRPSTLRPGGLHGTTPARPGRAASMRLKRTKRASRRPARSQAQSETKTMPMHAPAR